MNDVFLCIMFWRRVHITLALLMLLSSNYGQYRLKHYNVNDGLSQNTVNDVLQDSKGFLWLATQEGLNRFDGYQFEHFDQLNNNSESIIDQFIWGLKEDHLGNIWCCSREGVSRIDGKTFQVTNFLNDIDNNGGQRLMIEIVEQEVWITTSESIEILDAAQQFNRQEYQLTDTTLKKRNIAVRKPLSIYYDQSHKLAYILTQFGIANVKNNKIQIASFTNELDIYRHMSRQFLIDGDWVYAATNQGLFKYRSTDNSMESISSDQFKSVYSLVRVDDEIWVSTETGVYSMNSDQFKQLSWKTPMESTVLSMYKDQGGLIWLNTSNDGCYMYDPSKEQFKFLSIPDQYGVVWDIRQFDSQLWLTTDGGVLKYQLDEEYISYKHLSTATSFIGSVTINNQSISNATCLYEDIDGRRYIGTRNEGVYVLDSNEHLAQHLTHNYHTDLSNHITSIVEFDNLIWVTTHYGIYRYNKSLTSCDTLSIYSENPIPTNYVFKAILGEDGNLWLGTNKGTVIFKDNDHFTHLPYAENGSESSPSFYFINDIIPEKEKAWICTFGGGVDLYLPETGKFINYNKSNGLKNLNCSAILTDNNSTLWVGHNKGISRLDHTTNSFINFNVSDGLLFNEIALNSSFKNNEGILFFGTPEGIIAFDPEAIKTQEIINPPTITKTTINYSVVNFSDVVELWPKDKVISFEFSALDYQSSNELKYAYKIDGIDNEWAVVDAAHRIATYSTLPYGEHLLQIKTIGINGKESKALEVQIVVLPPFWYTWWFLLLIVLFIVLIVFICIRFYYKKQLKKQLLKLEIEQKVLAEKERISSDLHDNVGAQITHIIHSLDHEVYRLQKQQFSGTEKLNEISDFARHTMDELRNTIWVINNESVTILEFKNKVLDYLAIRFQESGISTKVELKGNEHIKLEAKLTLNIFRIIQETVTNTIKHSGANQHSIIFSYSDNLLKVVIQDNGNGTIVENKPGHFGLQNMKQRAKAINGDLNIIAVKNKGTTINLTLPL